MKPIINTFSKGKIIIENNSLTSDFYINIVGEIVKRDLRNSKSENKSHQVLSLVEAGQIYDPSINEMIIGCNDCDKLILSNEAIDFFEEKQCKIKLLPIAEAIIYWNRYEGHAIGLFHLPKHNN